MATATATKSRKKKSKHANTSACFYVSRDCWVASWWSEGRRRIMRLPTAIDKESAMGEYQRKKALLAPLPEEIDTRPHTIRTPIEVFERQVMCGYRKATRSVYRQMFELLKKAGITLLSDIRVEKLRSLQDVLIAEQMIASTQHKILRTVKRFFRWMRDVGYISDVPRVMMPKVRKKSKGRPLTDAEFETLLKCVDKVYYLKPDRAAAFKRLMYGLWWGGLRVGEIDVSWDDRYAFHVDWTSYKRPVFVMPDQLDKTAQARVFPMAPEFWKLIESTPESERHGPVFSVLSTWRKERLTSDRVSKLIQRIGRLSGVVVDRVGDEVKYASAHDLRRSFILRWASRVNQMQCGALARHVDPKTTSIYYIGRNAANLMDGYWGELSSLSK